MLVHSLKLTLLLLVAWVGYANSQILSPTPTNNGYKFEISISKSDINMPDTIKRFRVFWHFGNEQYHLSSILTFSGDSMITHSVIHNPPDGLGDFNNIYAEITPLTYTDNAEPEREIFLNQISLATCASCLPPVPEPTNQVDLLFNRSLVAGHRVTLIIPYQRRCGIMGSPSGNEKITLYYASDQIELENSNTLIHGAGIPDGTMPLPVSIFGAASPYLKKLEFQVTPESSTQYLYIPMRVASNLNPPQNMDIRLTYDFDATCMIEEREIQDSGIVNPGGMLAFSHDPNNLASPSVFICDCEQQDTVRYVVKFQNVGMAPADTVIIKDIIPDAYDINSINIVHPIDPITNLPPPQSIDPTTREVTWIIAGDHLRDTLDLLGTASGADEHKTIDSLVFGITIANCNAIKSCDAIFNQAEIIFDCNPPIYTNPHLVRFGCKTLFPIGATPGAPPGLTPMPPDSCVCKEVIFPRDTILLSASDSTTNFTDITMVDDLINDFNAVHRWYPTYDVWTPASADSKVVTPKTRSYFQVLSTTAQDVDFDCHRVIRETVVQIDCPVRQIQYELTCHPPQPTGNKDIKAWLPNNTTPLIWRGIACDTTLELKAYDVPGTEILLTAYDPITSCSYERLVDLTDCPERRCWFIRWWQGIFSPRE